MTTAIVIVCALLLAGCGIGVGIQIQKRRLNVAMHVVETPHTDPPGALMIPAALMSADEAREFAENLGRDPEQQRVHDEMANQIEELTRALDTKRPAPDPIELAHHLQTVWMQRTGTAIDSRWQPLAETAIDYTRGLWPATDTAAEGGAGTGLPVAPSPAGDALGGGTIADTIADVEKDLRYVADQLPEVPGFDPATVRLARIFGSAQFKHLSSAMSWMDMTPLHPPVLRAARAVLDAGYRRMPTREALAQLLAAHDIEDVLTADFDPPQPGPIEPSCSCTCGEWTGLPIFHADHVAAEVLGALTAAGATR